MGFLAELGHGPLSECLEQLKGPLVVAAVVVATKEVTQEDRFRVVHMQPERQIVAIVPRVLTAFDVARSRSDAV